jgi:hypothetical protein
LPPQLAAQAALRGGEYTRARRHAESMSRIDSALSTFHR